MNLTSSLAWTPVKSAAAELINGLAPLAALFVGFLFLGVVITVVSRWFFGSRSNGTTVNLASYGGGTSISSAFGGKLAMASARKSLDKSERQARKARAGISNRATAERFADRFAGDLVDEAEYAREVAMQESISRTPFADMLDADDE